MRVAMRRGPALHCPDPPMIKYQTYLLFGAPGSGKGTQGRVIGRTPGYFHCACGDVFRTLDVGTPIGQKFLEYSSRGELVPDDLTVKLWKIRIDQCVETRSFYPERNFLVLDGIPRNVHQAQMLEDALRVRRLFHLSCPDRDKLVDRLKRRALRDNRFDDANEEVIRRRLETYEQESRPLLEYYGGDRLVEIDATQAPIDVLRQIVEVLAFDRRNHFGEEGFEAAT
jgi:adenylate kinase